MPVVRDARLYDSPALGLALYAHAELHLKGWSDVPQLSSGADVLRYTENGLTLGLLVFAADGDESAWYVELSWVDPSNRMRGIHKLLWGELVGLAQECGVRKIEGGTHVDNIAMNAVMRAEGRRHTYNWYSFEVPPGRLNAASCSS